MSAVVSIFNGLPIRAEKPAPTVQLTQAAQEEAERIFLIIKPAVDAVQLGASVRAAVAGLVHSGASGLPSEPTLRRWVRKYVDGGFEALAKGYKGRQREVKGCEALILQYYQKPSKPNAGTISFWLMQDHGIDCPAWWIRSYLKSLPSNQAETSPKRLGRHYYDQNIRPHQRRSLDDIDIGEVMVSDGNRLKVICYHPITGDLFRAEITPVLDKKSNYIYAFWAAANESSMDIVYALCSVMGRYNHVPTWFQSDPGPGFLNKRTAALFERLGIKHVPTRGGNARGKDFGEGIMNLIKERFAKQFDTYCGDDRTDDALARMRTKVKRGELQPPTFAELKERLEKFRVAYNAWPQKDSQRLKGQSPLQAIANIKQNPLAIPVEDLLRPFVNPLPTVRHWEVRFRNRFYRHPELAKYEGRKVVVQYDEFDESRVWVRDAKHRLICTATLVQKIGWAKENVAADVREKSRQAAIARLQGHMDEINDRANTPIAAADVAAVLHFDQAQLPSAPSVQRQLADQGDSFRIPTVIKHQPRRQERAIDAELIERTAAEVRASQQPEETPEQRFERARMLERQLDAGMAVVAAQREWLQIYQTTPEYIGQRRVFDAFNQ